MIRAFITIPLWRNCSTLRKISVLIDKKKHIGVIYGNNCASSSTKLKIKKNLYQKPTSLVSTGPIKADSEETLLMREASWRTMKYTLLFLGATFLCTGTYLVFEFGKPEINQNGEIIQDEFADMSKVMQYCHRTLKAFNHYKRLIREPSREKLLPDVLKPPYYQPPYTLVLELTDVLVHPDWTYNTGWRFKKRPYVDYFLETLNGLYEIVIYTAEQGLTVFPIVDALDPKNLIMYKLVRDATHFVDGEHIKDLDKLNRNLNKVIVIDWNLSSVKLHPDNVFRISRWDGNDQDTALLDLTSLLVTVANSGVEDVREVLNHYNSFDDSLRVFRENQRLLLEQQESKSNTSNENAVVTKWTKTLFTNPFNIKF